MKGAVNMRWYSEAGKESDVVVSSRVRLARNIADKPFMSRIDESGAKEVIERVRAALSDGGYDFIDFADISPDSARAYAERHEVSADFIGSSLPHALLRREADGVDIMLCEEDHLRLQCILPGLALKEAFETVAAIDDRLGERVPFAFDEQLGYLTGCPTNLGTGMRASVMVFLPAMSTQRQIGRLSASLGKIGLTIRGFWGEGSDADGCLYQISNQITLGVTEDETLEKLGRVLSQIVKLERQAREALAASDRDALRDRLSRSLGVMKSAYLMSTREFMELFADVRLGIALGMVEGVDYGKLGELLINVLPANLTSQLKTEKGDKDAKEHHSDERRRDIARAAAVRRAFANV